MYLVEFSFKRFLLRNLFILPLKSVRSEFYLLICFLLHFSLCLFKVEIFKILLSGLVGKLLYPRSK